MAWLKVRAGLALDARRVRYPEENSNGAIFPGNGMDASQRREGEVNIAYDSDRIASWEAGGYNFFTAQA